MPDTDPGQARQQFFPLTIGQEWHYRELAKTPELRTAIHTSYRIAGEFDVAAFVGAVNDLVCEHDALRISIVRLPDDSLAQYARGNPPKEQLIVRRQVRAASEEQFSRYARAALAADLATPWDLVEEYPFRFKLFRYNSTLHAFLASFSHLSLDGRGRALLTKRLWDLYAERIAGHHQLGGACPKLFEAAARQSSEKQGAAVGQRLSSQAPAPLGCNFKPQYLKHVADGHGQRDQIFIQGERLRRMREKFKFVNASDFQGILGIFASVIFGMCTDDRITISVPVDARRGSMRHVVGMFTLPVPLVFTRSDSADELVRQSRRSVLRAALRPQDGVQGKSHNASPGQRGGETYIKAIHFSQNSLSPAQGIGRAVVRRGVYAPQVRYASGGLDLRVVSTPDLVEVSVLFSERLSGARTRRHLLAELEAGLLSCSGPG